ncbi:MAG: hypothetical protein D6790_12255 [Caldilineae bacterium]|nr:MAG: hypothetical protein D6790_12255 [Caldilineae bacterium]
MQAVLAGETPDRTPRFEIWIDALLPELGQPDTVSAHVNLGQDAIMLPSHQPPESNAWRNGVDEWGRVWQDGMYVRGVVDTEEDLARYSPPVASARDFFDPVETAAIAARHPDHCLIFGTHVGPFMAGYMAMGFEPFFFRLLDDPAFIHRLLEHRTAWCIQLFQAAIDCGAEVIVLGDDAAHRRGPMIGPDMWRTFVLPYHHRIVEALSVPVIWHSDGDIRPLLPLAVEAGFTGVHGLEPLAGIDLAQVKQAFGDQLVLIGNADVNVLCRKDLAAVRREVDRCLAQGAPGGRYMLATCNSIFEGMDPDAVAEFFRYQAAVLDNA